MFTPEFLIDSQGEYILVANHCLENETSVHMSIGYNKARIAFAEKNLPSTIQRCRLIYDIRGQSVTEAVLQTVKQSLESLCLLEFKQ